LQNFVACRNAAQAGMTSPWVYDAEEYYWAEPSFVVHRKGQKWACSRFTPYLVTAVKSGARKAQTAKVEQNLIKYQK
jgi:hypothetical protein